MGEGSHRTDRGYTFFYGARSEDHLLGMGTHCTGGWVGLRAGQDTEAKGKVLSPLPGIEPRLSGRPACSQTLY
jgi:hypothetical protein